MLFSLLPGASSRKPEAWTVPHMLRVRIFQVEVVMAHVLETSVPCPGPAGLGCWLWVVAGIQTTGHRIMADQRAGL